jgi:hypothetical protein
MAITTVAVQLTERNTKVVKDNKKMVNVQTEKGKYVTAFLPAFFEIGDVALISGKIETEQNGEYTNHKFNFPVVDKVWIDAGTQPVTQQEESNPFKQRWVEKSELVQREKGITNPQSLIPQGVLSRFMDAFERPGGLLRHLYVTPLTDLQVGWDSATSTGVEFFGLTKI